MKICVSSTGQEKNALVDLRFGRCPYFVVFDVDSKTYAVYQNGGITASGGAGIAAAQTVIDTGAEVVLTGNIGPNAMELLKSNEIRIVQAAGRTVEEAVKAYDGLEGKEISDPVPAHYGMGNQHRRGW